MIHLIACGVNGVSPNQAILNTIEMEALYRTSYSHFLDALVGTTSKNAGVALPKYWADRISKAVRKVVLFDAERAKLLSFMEQKGIWYLPLKGVILKEYYPALGMRQMSDNDILFDDTFCDEVQQYMEAQGYKAESVGVGNHDVYQKEPVYNFEMHKSLYSTSHQEGWEAYYRNVKDKLVLNEGASYGYHFTDEDFYVYITSHAYKHYIGSGTGVRTLLDFYVYLKAKSELDFAYIEKECKALGIAEFEKRNRRLCKKVFDATSITKWDDLKKTLTEEEREMLYYYLSSGVYGTMERGIENNVRKLQKKNGKKVKFHYLWNRLFPDRKAMEKYPSIFAKHKLLLPLVYVHRLLRLLFDKKRLRNMLKEIKIVKKMK